MTVTTRVRTVATAAVLGAFLAAVHGADAGAPEGWTPGVEGQRGAGPAVWSPDGRFLAVTRWDRAALAVVPADGTAADPAVLSVERGAGYHPVWAGGGLLFKEVVPGADGAPLMRVVWSDPAGRERLVLAQGPRVGDPSVSGDGTIVAWTVDARLVVRRAGGEWPLVTTARLPGYADLVELDATGASAAFNHPDGSIGVLDLDGGGGVRWLTGPGAHAHPDWSPDGASLLIRGPGDRVAVLDPRDGTVLAEGPGLHASWWPGTSVAVVDRVDGAAFRVLGADLWAVDAATGRTWRLTDGARHERFPEIAPDGASIAFVDTRGGDLLVAPLTDAGPGPARVALAGTDLPWAPPPPPVGGLRETVVDVPYMHQLWDTPDDFDGGWSCGPTSCLQTVQRYQELPDADITCSWPSSHTSHWGWYIPNEYTHNGTTYDTLGLAAGDVWVPGVHGFICREYGAAVWDYMVDWCTRHDVDSWWAGTSFGTLGDEVDAGYPMYASTSVLGYGHIIVMRGYDNSGYIVVNDPYGDANGSWGQYDGEGAVYDWPGYNTGHLEITVSQVFTARGTVPDTDPEWDAVWVAQESPETMVAGQTAQAWIEYRNEGTHAWDTGDTRLGTTVERDRASPFVDEATWIGANRPTAVDAAVPSGSTGRFSFLLRAPDVEEETTYVEHWGLVQENVTWFGPADDEVWFEITVIPAGDAVPPVADAGADRVVLPGQTVELDGSGSYDPDGTIESWRWQTPDGVLEGERTVWTPSEPGVVEIELTVTDDVGLTASDGVTVEVDETGDGGEGGCRCSAPGGAAPGPVGALLVLGVALAARRRREEA